MRRLLLVLGALAVVATSFLVTLLVLNYLDRPRTPEGRRDAIRAQHARLLRSALDKYKATNGKYPVLPDNDASDLRADLVGGGYLAEMPKEPQSAKGRIYRYSSNGKVYGLMFQLEAGTDKIQPDGSCLVRAQGDDTSFWSNPPACPF